MRDDVLRARVQPGTFWAARDKSDRRLRRMQPVVPDSAPVVPDLCRVRVLDGDDPAPLHEQLAGILRERVASGELPGRLPVEHELAALYGCSRDTVRRSLAILTNEGLVYAVRGRGTFARTATQTGPE